MFRFVPTLLLVLLGSGCASFGTLTEARALGPGWSEFTASGQAAAGTGVGTFENGGINIPLPNLEFGLRRGLGSGVDLGIYLAPLSGLRADVKVQFVRGRALDVAFDPGLSLHILGLGSVSYGQFSVQLPLLFGTTLGPRNRGYLSFGPKVVAREPFSIVGQPPSQASSAWFALDVGGMAGWSKTMGPLRRTRLGLSVDALVDPVGRTGFKFALNVVIAVRFRPEDLRKEGGR